MATSDMTRQQAAEKVIADTVFKSKENWESQREISPETVHYRVVADREMLLLKPLFDNLGWPMPDADFSKVVVAEAGEGDKAYILGFAVVQFITHCEPLWIHPSTRGTGVAEGLIEHVVHYVEVDCKIKRYVCTCKPGSFAARLAEKHGMKLVPGAVYAKQV